MKKIIIPCSNATELAAALSTELKCETAQFEYRKFPDNEIYFRIDTDLKGTEAIIVQSGFPNPNDSLVELILAIDSCKTKKAKSITAVVPYFPYARQDKVFKPGEAFSLQVIAKILKNLGIKRMVTFDAHFHEKEFGKYKLFGLNGINLSAGPILAEYIKNKFDLGNLHIISPDLGASELVKNAAKKTNSTFSSIEKKRTGDYQVEMSGKLDVSGKNVLVLDDIISTGGTMLKAIDLCKQNGAEKVFCAATHGLFVKESLEKLKNVSDYLVASDSIKNEVSEVSLAKEIARVL